MYSYIFWYITQASSAATWWWKLCVNVFSCFTDQQKSQSLHIIGYANVIALLISRNQNHCISLDMQMWLFYWSVEIRIIAYHEIYKCDCFTYQQKSITTIAYQWICKCNCFTDQQKSQSLHTIKYASVIVLLISRYHNHCIWLDMQMEL